MNSINQPTELPVCADSGKATDKANPASGAAPFLVGTILLGTIGIFVHEANAHPLTATWFRCAFGLLGLTVWILLRQQGRNLRLPPAAWVWVLAAGGLMVLGWGLFFAAIERTSAGVATVLFHIQPLWVLALAVWWLNESITRGRLVSLMAAMVGLVLATGILEHSSATSEAANESVHPEYWLGVAFCLTGAFCTACVTLIAKRLHDLPVGVLAWWQCAIGTIALVAWPITHGWPAWDMSWMWLSGLGLIHTGLAYSLMYSGMGRLSTERIAMFQFVYPAVVILIDWLVYEQHLGSMQIGGIAMMAVAISFAERVQRKRQPEFQVHLAIRSKTP